MYIKILNIRARQLVDGSGYHFAVRVSFAQTISGHGLGDAPIGGG